MTKMAAMPIYGKNPSKIFFAGTAEPIATKIFFTGTAEPIATVIEPIATKNGQNIYEFENEINPRVCSDPVLGLYTCI